LVEMLVSVMVISILMLGVYSLIILALRISADNKSHTAAIEIANQKMEEIRNLPYTDVGTASGSPTGVLPDYETINREGAFRVHNTVMFYDDPYDGTVASGTDSIFVDYKIATVEVTWQSGGDPSSVTLFSKIIPRTEETLAGYGLLKIQTVDASGDAVSNADIHIENEDNGISVDLQSNSQGVLDYPVPPGFENYEVTVTKPGYGVDKTYDRTAENPNPTRPHLSVTEGDKTEEAFSIDLLGQLTVKTIMQDLPPNWRVNTDSSLEAQSNARLAFDASGYMYLVWQDYRDSSDAKIYAQKYDPDGNQQWSDDQRLGSANRQILPDVETDSAGSLYACWNDDSGGNQDTYIDKRLPSDGSPDPAWGGELKVNTLADSADQNHSRIAISEPGGSILTNVVWQDDRDGAWDIYFQQYDQSKTAMLSPEMRVNTNPIASGTDQYAPALAAGNDHNLFVAWSDNRTGYLGVYGAKISSTTTSRIWERQMNETTTTTDQYSPTLDVGADDNIYVAWTDERNGDKDVYAQKFDQAGNPVWTDDLRLNTDSSLKNQYEPSLAVNSANEVYVAWTDKRNGNRDVYAHKYDSAGNPLWPKELRVSISSTTAAEYNPDVTINPADDKAYVTWQSDENGNLDIYAAPMEVYGSSSTIPDVPLRIHGNKRIGDSPVIYEYDEEHWTDANGELNLAVEWDTPGYEISLKSASTTYSMRMSSPAQPVEVLPDSNTTVTLYLE